ncbi:MAG: linear amide C-N hydrolase [Paludibacteraceae bacterium]|nr:linear amide C-N hydrolase [Paludibacteraceae bacterium]
MRKLFFAFMALAAISLVGCKERNDEPQQNDGIIQVTHQLGEKVTNPVNAQWCKPQTAEATLTSLRCISDIFYYMDYQTDMQLDDLLAGNYRTREEFERAFSDIMFYPEGEEPIYAPQETACSGFVCKNEQGEILLGRNFDGDFGPMVMLFNRANGAKYVQMTDPCYNSILYINRETRKADGTLSNGTASLHRLLRQPLLTMDGMNEYGLCFGAFQLPKIDTVNIFPIIQTGHGDAMGANLMHNLILSKCKTVKEVEEFMSQHDYVTNNPTLNVHWLMADATGDWAMFEFWDNELNVYREDTLYTMCSNVCTPIPYEWYSIENYYRSWVPYTSYPKPGEATKADWQAVFSSKVRATHMMNNYRPVMSEMEALKCLQEGRYSLEVHNKLTNWSCVYNPKQRTILFALRNDMSKIYKLDLKTEL